MLDLQAIRARCEAAYREGMYDGFCDTKQGWDSSDAKRRLNDRAI